MKKRKLLFIGMFSIASCASILYSCSKDEHTDLATSGFPAEVGRIILGKCATSGCHNDLSYEASAGLNLGTWDKMFEGGRGGACIVPFRPDFSTCMYYVNNNYPEFGLSLQPRMPYQKDPLSYDEIKTLYDWILAGAPNREGKIKFADNPERRKIYVTNQGCDEVSVIDAETKLVMRYIRVGINGSVESPHMVRVSPDGHHWYVVFLNSTVMQKFRTADDSYVGSATIGTGSWNTFTITSDSRYAYVADWSASGKIKYVDLEDMTVLQTYAGSGLLDYPHGTVINPGNDTLWAGSNNGNFIYRIEVSDPLNPSAFDKITLDGLPPSANNTLNPHEVVMSPDGKKLFVTCQQSDEVRILNAADTSLIAVIPTGDYPLEVALSESTPYAFVTCEEDTAIFPGAGKRGMITVFNYVTNTFVAHVDAGAYQPHGIAVDDVKGLVYVASRNINPSGPAPHHSSNCAGKNGFITVFDLYTFQRLAGFRTELSVDPYSISIRR